MNEKLLPYVTLDDLPETVRDQITTALKTARSHIVDSGAVPPVILLFTDDNLHVLDAAAENERDKDQVAFATRQMVKVINAHTVMHVSEIWGLPEDMGAENITALLRRYGSVSACPQRIEQVMIKVETRAGGQWLARATIRRKGRAVTLDAPTILDLGKDPAVEAAGRYAGWFAPEKPVDLDHLPSSGNK